MLCRKTKQDKNRWNQGGEAGRTFFILQHGQSGKASLAGKSAEIGRKQGRVHTDFSGRAFQEEGKTGSGPEMMLSISEDKSRIVNALFITGLCEDLKTM